MIARLSYRRQVQKNWHDGEISYVLTGEEGPDHDKTFLVRSLRGRRKEEQRKRPDQKSG